MNIEFSFLNYTVSTGETFGALITVFTIGYLSWPFLKDLREMTYKISIYSTYDEASEANVPGPLYDLSKDHSQFEISTGKIKIQALNSQDDILILTPFEVGKLKAGIEKSLCGREIDAASSPYIVITCNAFSVIVDADTDFSNPDVQTYRKQV